MGDFKQRGGFGGGNGGGFKRGGFGGSGGASSGGFGGDRPRFGGRPGGKDFRNTQMFSATCAECNKPCEVPFRPNGEKPVYCNYCFGKNKASAGYSSTPSHSTPASRPSFDGGPKADNSQIADLKKQLNTINTKLDTLIEKLSGTSSSSKKIEAVEVKAEAPVEAKKPVKAKKAAAKKK